MSEEKRAADKEKEKMEKKIQAAEQILNRMIQKITEEYPIFGMISECFTMIPVMGDILFETDTKNIFYSPFIVLKYVRKKMTEELKYGYLHILCHGILNHFTIGEDYCKKPVMHRLMDLEVFYMLEALGIRRKACEKLMQTASTWYGLIGSAMSKNGLMKCYKNITRAPDQKEYRALMQSAEFAAVDHHECWMLNRQFVFLRQPPVHNEKQGNLLKEIQKIFHMDSDSMLEKAGKISNNATNILTGDNASSKMAGKGSSGEKTEVDAQKEARLNYAKVLRKFLKVREVNREDPESMDKALYSLGLQMYGNIPLIEPEDEAEYKCLGTVVLAIDTSRSCLGEPIDQFMAETKAIFRCLGKIRFKRFVILQCDDQIRKEDSYKSASQFPEMDQEEQECFGCGGTSFIPVFERICEFQGQGEKIECLIYFSDGYGEFPDKRPDGYETFFIVPKETEENVEEDEVYPDGIIPDWVHRLELPIS